MVTQAGRGLIAVEGTYTRANVSVRGSVLEANHDIGWLAGACDCEMDTTVVRDTIGDAAGLGRGLSIQPGPNNGSTSNMSVTRSLIERNREASVYVGSSEVLVEATVIRNTAPGNASYGRGIVIADDEFGRERANVLLDSSVIEQSIDFGVFVTGSDVVMQASVVRDTTPNIVYGLAGGVHVQRSELDAAPASAIVRASLIEQNPVAGVLVIGPASLELDASEVRDTTSFQGFLGDGIVIVSELGAATGTITGTRIDASERAAIANFGAEVTLTGSHFTCQSIDLATESWMDRQSSYQNQGGVLCGCPEAATPCHAQSYALAPPLGLD
jgi:hypothetical protein